MHQRSRFLQSERLYVVLIAIFVLLTRWLGSEHAPLHWDPVNFFCAATDYSIAADRPHLPGYPLHILLIRTFRVFLSPFAANVAPSILWSTLSVYPLYRLLRRYADVTTSLVSTLLFFCIPTVWHYGSVSEVYAFDLFFCLVLVQLGLTSRGLYWTPVVLALGGGFRQSSAVLVLPLYAYLWHRHWRSPDGPSRPSLRNVLLAHLSGLIVLAAWLVPFLALNGGVRSYIELYRAHPPGALNNPAVNLLAMLQLAPYYLSAFLGVGLAALVPSLRSSKYTTQDQTDVSKAMLALWILPPMVFFLLSTFTKGYIVLVLPAVLLLFLPLLRMLKPTVVLSISIIAATFYLVAPYRASDFSIWRTPIPGESKIDKAIERSITVMAQTQSHISALNNLHDEVDSCVRDLPRHAYVYVSLTFGLSARALQARHPEIRFVMVDQRNSDSLLVHSGIDQYVISASALALDSLHILCSKQEAELQSRIIVERRFGDYCWARTPAWPEDRQALMRWYRLTFGRSAN